jgi:hypothetical protein
VGESFNKAPLLIYGNFLTGKRINSSLFIDHGKQKSVSFTEIIYGNKGFVENLCRLLVPVIMLKMERKNQSFLWLSLKYSQLYFLSLKYKFFIAA